MSSRPLPQVFIPGIQVGAVWREEIKDSTLLKPFNPRPSDPDDYRIRFRIIRIIHHPEEGLGDLSGVAEIADVVAPVLAVHEQINFVRIPQQVFVGAAIDVIDMKEERQDDKQGK